MHRVATQASAATKSMKSHKTKTNSQKPHPSPYRACRPHKLPAEVRDPAMPPAGSPRPSRGIGSPSAERNSKPLTYNGHRMSRAAWARYLGISVSTIRQRLRNHPPEVALDPDFRLHMVEIAKKSGGCWGAKKRRVTERGLAAFRKNGIAGSAASREKAKRYTAFGKTLLISEWAVLLGVQWHTLYLRLKRMPVEKALCTGKYAGGPPRLAEKPQKGRKPDIRR